MYLSALQEQWHASRLSELSGGRQHSISLLHTFQSFRARSSELQCFNLNKITNELNSSLPNKNENKNNKRFEDFNKKYLENLDESSIKKLIEENKNNKIMFEFLNSKLSLFSNNSKQNFSNKIF